MKKYLHLWVQQEVWEHPERFLRLDSPSLFGDARPLEMEIGCGTGEFLCALASERPEINFLGIDPMTKAIFHAVRQAEALRLQNIRFVRAPMHVLYPLMVPGSLDAAYVHFPDPYVRSRGEHKVLNRRFMEAIHAALRPGKCLSVVSDQPELFEEALGLIDSGPGWERTHAERHLVGYDPPVKSRYQLKWERLNLQTLRVEVRKLPLVARATGA
jgi:tRNA (guanine-N7-)-methyltransferase